MRQERQVRKEPPETQLPYEYTLRISLLILGGSAGLGSAATGAILLVDGLASKDSNKIELGAKFLVTSKFIIGTALAGSRMTKLLSERRMAKASIAKEQQEQRDYRKGYEAENPRRGFIPAIVKPKEVVQAPDNTYGPDLESQTQDPKQMNF